MGDDMAGVKYWQHHCVARSNLLHRFVAGAACPYCGVTESVLASTTEYSITTDYGTLDTRRSGEENKGGVKHDAGKARWELLAPDALEGTARILTFGAKKYEDRNWEKGMSWSRVFGAAMRHLWAWWSGQDKDPETGESHLHHAACCIMFLQAYEARKIGKDDRKG